MFSDDISWPYRPENSESNVILKIHVWNKSKRAIKREYAKSFN